MYTYFLLIVAIGVTSLLLIQRYKLRINTRALMLSYAFISLPFIAWDMWAVQQGHWSFNSTYTAGIYLGNLVVSEVMFFFVVPLVCLAMFLLAVRSKHAQSQFGMAHKILVAIVVCSLLLLQSNPGLTYTTIVSVLAVVMCLALLLHGGALVRSKGFWWYQVALLFTFVAVNSVLAGLPIIEYGAHAINGTRVGVIPIEDFLYNFVLNSGFVLLYDMWSNKQKRL